MNLFRRLLGVSAVVVFAFAGGASARHHPWNSTCQDSGADDPLARAIQSLPDGFRTGRSFAEVRLVGLRTIDEETLWRALGGRPRGPVSSARASVLLSRLFRSGLFATVTPRADAPPDPDASENTPAVLELDLVEYPLVKHVIWRGLTEVQEMELLPALVDRDFAVESGTLRLETTDDNEPDDSCAPLRLRPEWIAQLELGRLRPGILVDGVDRALDRVVEQLHDDGYVLGSLTADLDPSGDLVVQVDEGHLSGVEIQGADPAIEPRLRAELGLQPGKVFLLSDLESGLERVGHEYPFLSTHLRERSLYFANRVISEPGDAGAIHFRTVQRPLPGREKKTHWTNESSIHLEGALLVVPFKFEPVGNSIDWSELLHHSQVTSFAPGLAVTLRLQDPADRVSLSTQAAVNFNTGSPSHRVDWLFGPKLQIPALHLAELGVHFYSLDDSEDRWRVGNLDSYLNSALFNRPGRDYFRRSGTDAFLTFWAEKQLVLGAEYRNDMYQSLPDASHYYTLFYRREPQFPNAAITDGRIGSALFRLEWSTEQATMQDFNSRYRAPTVSIVERHLDDGFKSGFTTVNTVEFANRGLGSDPGTQFIRVVSDNVLQVRTSENQGLRLRLRGAGGDHLPVQKQEALGGWTALRGYDYKEFAGDYSILGTAEYRYGVFAGFADLGTVRRSTGWIAPKLGLGAAFILDHFSLEAAWRADDQARLIPELRLVIRDLF